MRTRHRVILGDASEVLRATSSSSIDLMVTSPPYPMIQMWDGLFSRMDPRIAERLRVGDGEGAFVLMHRLLERTWGEVAERIADGGTVCINIGDATRTFDGRFRVYPNHSEVGRFFAGHGYDPLPEILWRKQSNKPNKFMGSGMLPPGAYVTQEHEYIMVYRRAGGRRRFPPEERLNRRRSAFFWEERNLWFSDLWDGLRGERQAMRVGEGRTRSAAYPFELAHRLVCMFSVRGDLVLDPFAGTGVTTLAAIANARNSVAIEIDPSLRDFLMRRIPDIVPAVNEFNRERLDRHARFAREFGDRMLYTNRFYDFPVMTRQETDLEVPVVSSIERVDEETFEVTYGTERGGGAYAGPAAVTETSATTMMTTTKPPRTAGAGPRRKEREDALRSRART